MTAYDYDLLVIGAGSGGVRAARIAAGHGAKVAVAEEYRVGGTCVIRGCVPKKLFVYAAHFGHDFEDAAGYGWTLPGHPSFDWPTLVANKDKEIDRLNRAYLDTLANAKVELFESRAVLVSDHEVAVGDRRISADKILIATGGRPNKPDLPGAALGFTSNEAFHLAALPKRMLIVGGGYIATEFAGIFNGLGVKVVQNYRREMILRGFDDDMRRHVQDAMAADGVEFRLNSAPTAIRETRDGLAVTMSDGGEIATDALMWAVGRDANTEGLGLDAAGVAVNSDGSIPVDEYSRTNVENIYAVGDVTGRIALTPVAIKEGHAFADTVFGNRPRSPDHDLVPSAVFSQPSIGTVGLTEAEARKKYSEIKVYRSNFKPMRNTLAGRSQRALAKMIVDAATDRVVGVHMAGPEAAEIIQGIAVAVKMGATKADFDATVAIHPSSAEEFVLLR